MEKSWNVEEGGAGAVVTFQASRDHPRQGNSAEQVQPKRTRTGNQCEPLSQAPGWLLLWLECINSVLRNCGSGVKDVASSSVMSSLCDPPGVLGLKLRDQGIFLAIKCR